MPLLCEVLDESFPFTKVEKDMHAGVLRIYTFEDGQNKTFAVRMMRPEKNEIFESRVGLELEICEINATSQRPKATTQAPANIVKFYATVMKILQDIIEIDDYSSKKKCYMMAIPMIYYDRMQKFALRIAKTKLRAAIGDLYFESTPRTLGRNAGDYCMFMSRRGYDMAKIIKPNIPFNAANFNLSPSNNQIKADVTKAVSIDKPSKGNDSTINIKDISKSPIVPAKPDTIDVALADNMFNSAIGLLLMFGSSKSATNEISNEGSVIISKVNTSNKEVMTSIKQYAIAHNILSDRLAPITKMIFSMKTGKINATNYAIMLDSLRPISSDMTPEIKNMISSHDVNGFLKLIFSQAKSVLFKKSYQEFIVPKIVTLKYAVFENQPYGKLESVVSSVGVDLSGKVPFNFDIDINNLVSRVDGNSETAIKAFVFLYEAIKAGAKLNDSTGFLTNDEMISAMTNDTAMSILHSSSIELRSLSKYSGIRSAIANVLSRTIMTSIYDLTDLFDDFKSTNIQSSMPNWDSYITNLVTKSPSVEIIEKYYTDKLNQSSILSNKVEADIDNIFVKYITDYKTYGIDINKLSGLINLPNIPSLIKNAINSANVGSDSDIKNMVKVFLEYGANADEAIILSNLYEKFNSKIIDTNDKETIRQLSAFLDIKVISKINHFKPDFYKYLNSAYNLPNVFGRKSIQRFKESFDNIPYFDDFLKMNMDWWNDAIDSGLIIPKLVKSKWFSMIIDSGLEISDGLALRLNIYSIVSGRGVINSKYATPDTINMDMKQLVNFRGGVGGDYFDACNALNIDPDDLKYKSTYIAIVITMLSNVRYDDELAAELINFIIDTSDSGIYDQIKNNLDLSQIEFIQSIINVIVEKYNIPQSLSQYLKITTKYPPESLYTALQGAFKNYKYLANLWLTNNVLPTISIIDSLGLECVNSINEMVTDEELKTIILGNDPLKTFTSFSYDVIYVYKELKERHSLDNIPKLYERMFELYINHNLKANVPFLFTPQERLDFASYIFSRTEKSYWIEFTNKYVTSADISNFVEYQINAFDISSDKSVRKSIYEYAELFLTPAKLKNITTANILDVAYGKTIYDSEIKPLEKMDSTRLKKVLSFNNITMKDIKMRKKPSETYGEMSERVIADLEKTELLLPEQKISNKVTDDQQLKDATNYLNKTRNGNHGQAYCRVLEVFDANLKFPEYDEYAKYNPSRTTQKRWFHSTGSVAASFIMRTGFTVIPSGDDSCVGRMLGDGIYLASNIDKSQQYLGDEGYGRNLGTIGYVFECEIQYTNLSKSGKLTKSNMDEDAAGAGFGGDRIRSPEIALRDPKSQIWVYKVYKCVLVSKSNIDRWMNNESISESKLHKFLNESVSDTISFTFGSGNIPVSATSTKPFTDFIDKPNIEVSYTQMGPLMTITNNLGFSGNYVIPDTKELMNNDPDAILPIIIKLFGAQ